MPPLQLPPCTPLDFSGEYAIIPLNRPANRPGCHSRKRHRAAKGRMTMTLIRRYNIWLSKLAMPVSAAALAWAFALSALSRMPAAFVRSTRVPASIAAPAPVPAPLAPFPRLDFKPRQHGKRYAPFRMHSVFFIPPAGRRRPGRSPAALRAASADCRPLRRAEHPSGLRPASPASLRRLGHFSPGSVIGSIYFPSFLAAKCRWLSIATSAVTVSTLPSTCPAVTRSPAFSAFSGATPQ